MTNADGQKHLMSGEWGDFHKGSGITVLPLDKSYTVQIYFEHILDGNIEVPLTPTLTLTLTLTLALTLTLTPTQPRPRPQVYDNEARHPKAFKEELQQYRGQAFRYMMMMMVK